MGLELVGGGQIRRESGATEPASADDSWSDANEKLAQAERELAGVRARLQALVDRAAELRRRLVPSGSAPRSDTGTGTR